MSKPLGLSTRFLKVPTSFLRPLFIPPPPSQQSITISRPYATSKPSLNIPSSAGGPQDPYNYCESLVKRLDPDAALISHFWPKRERGWWLAWRAFNLELHLISTTISQPALAAIRYQFWRDTLTAIFRRSNSSSGSDSVEEKSIPQHPVAVLLADMKSHRPIQKYYLSQMIDIRAKLATLPPSSPTLQSHLESHTPLTSSLLLGPLPLLLPPTHQSTSKLSHTLSHLSTLLTTVSLLRQIPLNVSKKINTLPSEVCGKFGVSDEELFRGGGGAKGVRDAIWEIGTRGMDELITARREIKGDGGKVVPESVVPLFLSAVPAEQYLKRLEQYDFDVFHPDLLKHDWKLAPRIWWAYQTGKL